MNVSINAQTMLFLYSALLGASIGVIYDLFRAIRYEMQLKLMGIFICDSLFCFISISGILMFILNFASGEGRFYIIFAIISGAILYFLTISLIIIKIMRFCFSVIYKLLIKIKKIYLLIAKKIAKNTFNFRKNVVK